jgi:hypothetical protein
VELLRADGSLIARPDTCIAVLSDREENGVARLSFVREIASATEPPFTLTLTHCIGRDEVFPRELSSAEWRMSTCSSPPAALVVGGVGTAAREHFTLKDGRWSIAEVSRERDGLHRSEFVLDFEGNAGSVVRARGSVELPEVFE